MPNSENNTKHRKKKMLDALEKTLGVVTPALKMADVSRYAYYDWLKKDEEFAKAVNECGEIALDFVESKLHSQIKDNHPTSTIFYLKTKGKKRGYTEALQIEGTERNDHKIVWGGDSNTETD